MPLPPLVALEIGTSKVRALVGEAREDGHLMITGIGETPSRGVRKSEIIHYDFALSCVRSALEEAEEQSRVQIAEVHLLVSGGHIQPLINRGSVPVMDESGEITPEDIDHVMETARAVNLPPDRVSLHTITQHYYVDDQEGVLDPAGMEGSKLAVDMLILHGVRTRMRNGVRVVASAHCEVSDVAFGGLCSALAVLTPEQKENGVLVVDLGGGTTDFVAYADQAIATAGSLAVGGDHVTNDLALGLRVPTTQAEKLKIEHASAIMRMDTSRQGISLPPEGGFSGKTVKRHDVDLITSARVEEILHLVKAHVDQTGITRQLGAGIVLTGGGAKLMGIQDLSRRIFDLPCDIGRPKNVSGVAVATEGPEYAAPVGLMRYGFMTSRRDTSRLSIAEVIKSIFWKG
ncbi:MAG: cell division protein FtsA [Verrucomicrobia bacterium]|nr:cell division protein FtsA [Verrucomicrobiota bacterium]